MDRTKLIGVIQHGIRLLGVCIGANIAMQGVSLKGLEENRNMQIFLMNQSR